MSPSQVVQRPEGAPAQLFLLFHGVGADAEDMVTVGRVLATEFPAALVVSIGGHEASDFGRGRQWFSIRDITEDNRMERVAAAMPGFLAAIRHWQREAGLGAAATALVGFSQGAIMALESLREADPVAGRVVGIAGRFAGRPALPPRETTVHLFHGKADPVMPYGHTVAAAEWLVGQGADITADILPFVGHGIDDEMLELLIERLKGYVPKRIWDEAMRADRGDEYTR
jgi:phospholipase/carboxylesterase